MKRFYKSQGLAFILSLALIVMGLNFVPATKISADDLNTNPAEGYSNVWYDDFTGNSLDTNIWNYDTGRGPEEAIGWGNKELQNYTDRTDNVKVKDGHLVITAKKEEYGSGKHAAHYTSGRIQTKDKKIFKYGKMEAELKVNNGNQDGVWPAFWTLGNDFETSTHWPNCGEIDIMEHANDNAFYSGALHWNPNGYDSDTTTEAYTSDTGTKSGYSIEDYHKYGVEWTESEIIWYLDDVEVFRRVLDENNAYAFQKDHYVLLNLALGSHESPFTEGVGVKTDYDEAEMLVKYVKVSYNEEEPTVAPTESTQAPTQTSSEAPTEPETHTCDVGGSWHDAGSAYQYWLKNEGRASAQYSGGSSLTSKFTFDARIAGTSWGGAGYDAKLKIKQQTYDDGTTINSGDKYYYYIDLSSTGTTPGVGAVDIVEYDNTKAGSVDPSKSNIAHIVGTDVYTGQVTASCNNPSIGLWYIWGGNYVFTINEIHITKTPYQPPVPASTTTTQAPTTDDQGYYACSKGKWTNVGAWNYYCNSSNDCSAYYKGGVSLSSDFDFKTTWVNWGDYSYAYAARTNVITINNQPVSNNQKYYFRIRVEVNSGLAANHMYLVESDADETNPGAFTNLKDSSNNNISIQGSETIIGEATATHSKPCIGVATRWTDTVNVKFKSVEFSSTPFQPETTQAPATWESASVNSDEYDKSWTDVGQDYAYRVGYQEETTVYNDKGQKTAEYHNNKGSYSTDYIDGALSLRSEQYNDYGYQAYMVGTQEKTVSAQYTYSYDVVLNLSNSEKRVPKNNQELALRLIDGLNDISLATGFTDANGDFRFQGTFIARTAKVRLYGLAHYFGETKDGETDDVISIKSCTLTRGEAVPLGPNEKGWTWGTGSNQWHDVTVNGMDYGYYINEKAQARYKTFTDSDPGKLAVNNRMYHDSDDEDFDDYCVGTGELDVVAGRAYQYTITFSSHLDGIPQEDEAVALKQIDGTDKSTIVSLDDSEGTDENGEITFIGTVTPESDTFRLYAMFKRNLDLDHELAIVDYSFAPVGTFYNVTVDGTVVDSIEAGEDFDFSTLDNPSDYGYIDNGDASNGTVYHKNSTVEINEDLSLTTIQNVNVAFQGGASMRMDKASGGLAFSTTGVGIITEDNTKPILSSAFDYGMLLAPEDMVYESGSFDLDSDYANKISFNTQANWKNFNSGVMMGGVQKMKSANLTRDFVAKAFVTIKYEDKTSQTFYSANSDKRNVVQIAKAIKAAADYYNSLPADAKEAVDYYASK